MDETFYFLLAHSSFSFIYFNKLQFSMIMFRYKPGLADADLEILELIDIKEKEIMQQSYRLGRMVAVKRGKDEVITGSV